MKKYLSTKAICISAVVAAIYAAITWLLAPITYGPIQCRVSEALTLLPLILPQSIPGLFVGCVLANILGGCSLLDIVFGSLTTLVAAILTYKLRNKPLMAALPPVVLNGVVVGVILHVTANAPLWETILWVSVGEAAAVYALGFLLLEALKKTPIVKLAKDK